MRKSTVVLMFGVIGVIASSCSVYTCPTYAKQVKEQPKAQQKI